MNKTDKNIVYNAYESIMQVVLEEVYGIIHEENVNLREEELLRKVIQRVVDRASTVNQEINK